jgi:hypothetical protein
MNKSELTWENWDEKNAENFKRAMQGIVETYAGDLEVRHVEADKLMCAFLEGLGFSEGVKIFEEMERWYA